MAIHELKFIFGDGATHDASVTESSAALEFCASHFWSLIPVFAALDASPLWTLEVSNDNVTFSPYATETDGAAIEQGFDDNHLAFKYMRVTYTANGNTTGTVEFTMIIK
jgi:hypothetical protein